MRFDLGNSDRLHSEPMSNIIAYRIEPGSQRRRCADWSFFDESLDLLSSIAPYGNGSLATRQKSKVGYSSSPPGPFPGTHAWLFGASRA